MTSTHDSQGRQADRVGGSLQIQDSLDRLRRALSIIRQNIVLSLAVKALFVVLTFMGYATLWAAIAADMGVSLPVIGNALRLLNSEA